MQGIPSSVALAHTHLTPSSSGKIDFMVRQPMKYRAMPVCHSGEPVQVPVLFHIFLLMCTGKAVSNGPNAWVTAT